MSRGWKSSEASTDDGFTYDCLKGDTSRSAVQIDVAIEGLSDVPLCLPSPNVGKALLPFFKSLSGGCIFTTSAAPGEPTGPQPLIISIEFSSIFNFLLLILL